MNPQYYIVLPSGRLPFQEWKECYSFMETWEQQHGVTQWQIDLSPEKWDEIEIANQEFNNERYKRNK